jgi:hypothetical protein
MNLTKEEKKEIVQYFVNGKNVLDIRFNPLGTDEKSRYKKKAGRYFTGAEMKYMKSLHDEINEGFKTKTKIDPETEEIEEYSDFDKKNGAKNKPDIEGASVKMKEKEKFKDDPDLNDILAVYFDDKNKDKIKDKIK